MTRGELLLLVARETGEPLGIVEQIVTETFATIRESLNSGRAVEIDGFGKFNMRRYEGRTERLPDRVVEHPPHQQPTFKATQEWRRQVNGSGEQQRAMAAEATTLFAASNEGEKINTQPLAVALSVDPGGA